MWLDRGGRHGAGGNLRRLASRPPRGRPAPRQRCARRRSAAKSVCAATFCAPRAPPGDVMQCDHRWFCAGSSGRPDSLPRLTRSGGSWRGLSLDPCLAMDRPSERLSAALNAPTGHRHGTRRKHIAPSQPWRRDVPSLVPTGRAFWQRWTRARKGRLDGHRGVSKKCPTSARMNRSGAYTNQG